MAELQEYYAARDIIENLLRLELIGPITPNETLRERPDTTYSIGILWPQKSALESAGYDSSESDEVAEEQSVINGTLDGADLDFSNLEDDLEDAPSKVITANTYKPSGMAITALVPADVEKIQVRFIGARYNARKEEKVYEWEDRETGEKETRVSEIEVFDRVALNSGLIELPIEDRRVFPSTFPLVEISLFVRHVFGDRSKLVTVCATNMAVQKTGSFVETAENAIFQSDLQLSVDSRFLVLGDTEYSRHDLEVQTLNLLYRNVDNYAIGHGCAVKWHEESGVVRLITSEFLPRADLLPMEPRSMDNLRLDLEFWSSCSREDGLADLNLLIDKYKEWFYGLQRQTRNIRSYDRAISTSFANIENGLERLQNGAYHLGSNEVAWQAFVLMNQAMLMQRVNSGKMQGREVSPSSVKWFPFQLAYIVQIIPDIVDEKSDWRDTVDLLWYPTGGGKTEAYLGLAAFTIFFRRLTLGDVGDGVTILMRYTLRLLTAQQFERATALICACEYLRQEFKLPSGEISIGLWVGSSVTPNSIENTKEALQKLRAGKPVRQGNPFQVFKCPFCGKDLDLGCYKVENDSLKIRCNNEQCYFCNGLPIYVVDDDIYLKRPSLVLSTVDKFARIVWQERTTAIFGSDGKTYPPDLIIQDELHLISGPLGSLTGLYESAVDELCTKNRRRPKVIASTATARNSVRQIKALYNRDSFQFPPTGLDIDDMFFAVRSDAHKLPSRRYLGICNTGSSMLDLLVRVYGCLLFSLHYLEGRGFSPEVIDQYYTIVGYFNTLRELGSSATVVSDRVAAYANSLRLHKFQELAQEVGMEEIKVGGHRELTSRRSTQDIKETLADLEYSYPDDRVLSYVLASNMLSVGIDISRLGTMTVYGQPKMNSEYIQATSRVGRSNPGLVITMYNNISSRDKSHFEQFGYYHQTFYKHVEPTSVTPFSFRALEKALHAVYVALVRHRIPAMRPNNGAANYNRQDPQVQEIREYILGRVEDVAPDSLQYAKYWLDEFESLWEREAQAGGDFTYALLNKSDSQRVTLLIESEKNNTTDIPSTLNSLRNVDGVSNVYLLEREG